MQSDSEYKAVNTWTHIGTVCRYIEPNGLIFLEIWAGK